MKTKFYAFLLLLTLGGGAHAVTLSDTAQAAVLSKKIIAAYTAEDYATTTKLFMEYDQLDAALPLPLVLVRVRAYYHLGEVVAAYQLLGDYLNLASPDSPDYDTALDMYIALEAKPGMTETIAKAEAEAEAKVKARFAREVGHQPSPTGRDADGQTDLHHAAQKNLREVAALLLNKGAAVNAKDDNGYTPLHDAAFKNAVATADLLIEKGAAIDAKNENGSTPLYSAVRGDARETVDLLLEKGAAIDAKDEDGRTMLHKAASSYDHKDVRLLLEKGADVNATDSDGDTPLHRIVGFGSPESLSLPITALLLEKGANVNVVNEGGYTPLALSILWNNDEIAALLRRHGGRK